MPPLPDRPPHPAHDMRGLAPLAWPRCARTPTSAGSWRDRAGDGWMWLVVVLLHAVFAWVLWHQMRPRPASERMPLQQDEPLEIRFITHASPPSTPLPPPRLAPPPPSKPRVMRPREPAARDAMTLQSPPTPPTPRLFGAQGEALLPATASSAPAPVPGYVQNLPQGDLRVMHHDDPVKYRATRFEQYFPPPDENLGASAVRHVVETVIKSTDVRLPGGTHLKCQTVLGVPIPNCINPPAPPSAKDGDERLSMAPAASLDGAAHGAKAPGEAACIAMYRAGKPLAWGCPLDTPNRAIDDERRKATRNGARGH